MFPSQIVFCHAGTRRLRNRSTQEFNYPDNMRAWINDLNKTEKLDAELEAYRKKFPAPAKSE